MRRGRDGLWPGGPSFLLCVATLSAALVCCQLLTSSPSSHYFTARVDAPSHTPFRFAAPQKPAMTVEGEVRELFSVILSLTNDQSKIPLPADENSRPRRPTWLGGARPVAPNGRAAPESGSLLRTQTAAAAVRSLSPSENSAGAWEVPDGACLAESGGALIARSPTLNSDDGAEDSVSESSSGRQGHGQGHGHRRCCHTRNRRINANH